jgi:hypothetical protein
MMQLADDDFRAFLLRNTLKVTFLGVCAFGAMGMLSAIGPQLSYPAATLVAAGAFTIWVTLVVRMFTSGDHVLQGTLKVICLGMYISIATNFFSMALAHLPFFLTGMVAVLEIGIFVVMAIWLFTPGNYVDRNVYQSVFYLVLIGLLAAVVRGEIPFSDRRALHSQGLEYGSQYGGDGAMSSQVREEEKRMRMKALPKPERQK